MEVIAQYIPSYCTPNLKLACFVYLKIVTLLQKIMNASYFKLSKALKNSIKI